MKKGQTAEAGDTTELTNLISLICNTIIHATAWAAYMDADDDDRVGIDYFRAVMEQYFVDEHLRRHVIRILSESPQLRIAAAAFYREAAFRIGVNPGSLTIQALGPDWRDGPVVYLDLGDTAELEDATAAREDLQALIAEADLQALIAEAEIIGGLRHHLLRTLESQFRSEKRILG